MPHFRDAADENINQALLGLKVAPLSATDIKNREIAAGHRRMKAKMSKFNGIGMSDIDLQTEKLAKIYDLTEENCSAINSMKQRNVNNCVIEWFDHDHPEHGYVIIACGKDPEQQTINTAIVSWKDSLSGEPGEFGDGIQPLTGEGDIQQYTYGDYLRSVLSVIWSYVGFLFASIYSIYYGWNTQDQPDTTTGLASVKVQEDSSTLFKNYFRYRALNTFKSERLLDYINCVDNVNEIEQGK